MTNGNYEKHIKEIASELSGKDPALVDIFRQVITTLLSLDETSEHSDIPNQLVSELSKVDIPSLLENIIPSINIIPGYGSLACHRYCVCFAFNKWNSAKGFKGIADNVINYWLRCSQENTGTIIFTTAWDELDFSERYLKPFESFVNAGNRTVAVVLISQQSTTLTLLL